MAIPLDIIGKTFGRLLVVEKMPSGPGGTRWKCLCQCSKEVVVRGSYLNLGRSRSCGCLQADVTSAKNTTHGLRYHPLYVSWRNIRNRTSNPKNQDYASYGGRGIKMYKPWFNSAETFIKDVEKSIGPKIGNAEIDRVNNDKDYEPGNIRWATRTIQNRNTRKSRRIIWNGVDRSLCDVMDEINCKIPYPTIMCRIYNGMDPVEALLKSNKRHGNMP